MQQSWSDTTPLNSKAIVDLTQFVGYDPDQKDCAATHEQLIVLRQVLCNWPSYEGLWVLLEHSPVHSGKFV